MGRNTRFDGTDLSPEHVGDEAADNLDLAQKANAVAAVASLTAGDEASNAIPVDIQLQDHEGNDLKKEITLECRAFDADLEPSVEAEATLAETGDGSEVSTTAKSGLLIKTDANGAAQVTVTDESGTLTGDIWLRVQPVDNPGEVTWEKLTFA